MTDAGEPYTYCPYCGGRAIGWMGPLPAGVIPKREDARRESCRECEMHWANTVRRRLLGLAEA